jgi:hypothetical protein
VRADVAARRAAQRLAERAGDDVDAVSDPEELGCARTGRSDKAHRVRVVDHHERVVAVGQVADLVQRRKVTVHREDAVGDNEPAPGAAGGLKLHLEVCHVPVEIAQAFCFAQPNAVDDRRVVERVRDDHVLCAEQHLEHAAIGVEA